MALISLPISWRTTIIVLYLIANFKSLPFVWHMRLLYQFIRNVSRRPIPPQPLPSVSKMIPASSARRILTHPVFTTTQIFTRTPLLEIDYNLHKSNSTYLTDMDVSRTQLVTRLYSPGFEKARVQLDKEGYKGGMVVVLGSVHVTFRKEIGIYERVGVRSRVLGWDGKWLVIMSYFVRTKRGGAEELCAVGLSKYVVKKGRFTVKPGRVLGLGGWLPKEKNSHEEEDVVNGSDEGMVEVDASPASSSSSTGTAGEKDQDYALSSEPITELAEKVVLDENAIAACADLLSTRDGREAVWNAEAWSWDEIEEERVRGMQLVKSWLALDTILYDEFEMV